MSPQFCFGSGNGFGFAIYKSANIIINLTSDDVIHWTELAWERQGILYTLCELDQINIPAWLCKMVKCIIGCFFLVPLCLLSETTYCVSLPTAWTKQEINQHVGIFYRNRWYRKRVKAYGIWCGLIQVVFWIGKTAVRK